MAPTPTKVAAKPAAAKPKTAKGALKKRPRKRNSELGNGIVRFSKTKMFHKKVFVFFDAFHCPQFYMSDEVVLFQECVTVHVLLFS